MIAANERNLPRLHLLGTWAIVLTLAVVLGGYFSWRRIDENRAATQRLAQVLADQQRARLQAELEAAMGFIHVTRSRTETELRARLREQVDAALAQVQAIYSREAPHRSAADVQRLIVETLRPVRFFNGRGYFFIDTLQGRFVLLPTAPQLEGQLKPDNLDDRGHAIMQGLIAAARRPAGEGYSAYRWFAPGEKTRMADKLAYVRHFAPYDWLIGTGDYLETWETQLQQQVLDHLRASRFGVGGSFAVVDRERRLILSRSGVLVAGQRLPDMPPAQRDALGKLLAQADSYGRYVQYDWPEPTRGGALTAKTARVQRYEPWGWTVIATIPNDELADGLRRELDARKTTLNAIDVLLPLLLALGLGGLASLGFSRWSAALFARYHADLAEKAHAVEESARLFRAVFDNAAVGLARVAPDGRFLDINTAFCELIGYPRDLVLGGAMTFQRITLDEDLPRDVALVQSLLQGERESYTLEKRYVRRDGRWVWVLLSVHLVRDALAQPLYFISSVSDISQRKSHEAALKLAASVFDHAREGIMITSPDGSIVDVNAAFTRITGYQRDEVQGRNPRMLSSGLQTPDFYAAMWGTLSEQGHWTGETWNRRRSGEVFAELQTISAVRDAQGQISHYVSLFSDITAMKAHQQQREHIAHYDALTGLPNRVLLADRLQQAMLQTQRRGKQLAVAFLDLDGFKAVNDRHGHDVGDKLLQQLAQRMKEGLREGDTLARLGGDEFVAVLVDLPGVTTGLPLIERLLAAAAQVVCINDKTLQVSASVGVTFFPQDESLDADQLQRQADQAMYQAKLAGKNRYHVFDAEQDRHLRGHHENLADIRRAIEQDELLLYYQPKVNMRSGRVIGFEALVRWQHPTLGLLAPGAFLPQIEGHALSAALDEWVLGAALRQLDQWQGAGLNWALSVNVGARQLQSPQFVERLLAQLAVHPQIAPRLLELEVLETSALEDIVGVSQVIAQCRASGLGFALDDFGTGYSSLTYLKQLPVSTIKIDQSFVRDLFENADDLPILRAVIGLARAFGRQVIAEGVETVAHGSVLLDMGCELIQGYGVARPMPAADLPAWVERWRPDPAWADALSA